MPARVLYITTLETTRTGVDEYLSKRAAQVVARPEEADSLLSLVAMVSSGVAGGAAALAAQLLVVPMDVVSQKQMVMESKHYATGGGGSISVATGIFRAEGWAGLYCGFSLSIFSSLPTGMMWWSVYGGCQTRLGPYIAAGEGEGSMSHLGRRTMVQIASGISAAIFASTLTQPFDTVKDQAASRCSERCASVLWIGGQKALRERGSCVFLERDIAARCTHGCVGHCIVFCV